MKEIQELGKRSSKIGKKNLLNSDKKFWKIYSRCFKGVNIKYSKWDKRSWAKYILKEDSSSFYGGMQEIQKLGRRSSKIWKKKLFDTDKKFWKIYSICSKGVNKKHSKLDKRSSQNIFWKRIQEVFMVECKKF